MVVTPSPSVQLYIVANIAEAVMISVLTVCSIKEDRCVLNAVFWPGRPGCLDPSATKVAAVL